MKKKIIILFNNNHNRFINITLESYFYNTVRLAALVITNGVNIRTNLMQANAKREGIENNEKVINWEKIFTHTLRFITLSTTTAILNNKHNGNINSNNTLNRYSQYIRTYLHIRVCP